MGRPSTSTIPDNNCDPRAQLSRLTRGGCCSTQHPLYSTDLVPPNFFVVSHLKLTLKRLRFADVTDIQQLVTTVLGGIPQEAFADGFQQNCVVPKCDYFEDILFETVLFIY